MKKIYSLAIALFLGTSAFAQTYSVTINVDMGTVDACATIDAVTLAGPVNGWSGSDTMVDANMDGVYSITFDSVAAGNFDYKARWHYAGNTNWEGGNNKTIAVSSDTTLPARCFGNDAYGACPSVPATADVTFIVDFTQATASPADTIWVMGTFTQWQSNAMPMTAHTVAGQYIATVQGFCPGDLEYKFTNGNPNDGANEEPVDSACGVANGVGGYNRYFARTGQADTLRHIFGQCSFISVEENALDAVAIYPNPMTDVATIALGTADFFTVQVMDITGRMVVEMDNVQGNVELNASEMGRGMYFVNIANTQGQVRTMKVVVE